MLRTNAIRQQMKMTRGSGRTRHGQRLLRPFFAARPADAALPTQPIRS